MHLNFPDRAAEKLRERVHGQVVVRGTDDGYHQARQGFVMNYQSFPQIIVYCEVESDVREALHFAKKYALSPVCRAGGHNTAGYAVNDGIVIDVRRINHISIDREGKRATVGAGVTFGPLNEMLDRYGLHVPGGGCDEVAIAGFMQGGGYGYTSMMYGMNCDSVVAAKVMLADGSTATASDNSEEWADLFWALRGGTGNNFGVLLEVTYRLHELGKLWGFGLRWKFGHEDKCGVGPVANALQVLQEKFTGPNAPRGLGHQSTLNFIDNEPHLILRGMYDGTEQEGKRVIQPLIEAGGCLDVNWRRGTYLDLNGSLNGDPMVPDVIIGYTPTQADSRYVGRQLCAEEWAKLVRYFTQSPNPGNFVGLEPYGGAIGCYEPSETAFLHRRASFDVYTWVFWMNPAQERQSLEFLEGFRRVMDEIGNGHAYQNYPNRANSNYRWMYWGENLERLQRIKEQYDPENLFCYGQRVSSSVVDCSAGPELGGAALA